MATRKNKGIPAADKNKQLVVQNITVRPVNRQSQDITNWRNATRAAEGHIPRRTVLYDLYFDITTTDGHIIAVWGKRVDAVTSAEWQYTDSEGNEVDEINQLIDCIGFGDMLTEIVNTEGWGLTWMEPSFWVNDNGRNEMKPNLIPRKHMRPDTGIVSKEQSGLDGININEGVYARTVMQMGNPTDLGRFLSAAQYAIYKRGDIGDWAEFIEIFGRGIIDAEWDGFDDEQRNKLAEGLNQMGGGGILIRPEGTKVNIMQNQGNANGQLQETFASFCNKEMSKALLGTTETTESSKSSGYAQSETHSDQDVKKNMSDIDKTRRILNTEFIKVLKAAGFDTKGGSFTLKSKKKINKDEFEVHKSMVTDLRIPVDDDFFYETYGVAKPDDYDRLKAEIEAKQVQPDANTHIPSQEKQATIKGKERQNTPPVELSDIQKADGSVIINRIQEISDRFMGRLKSFFVAAPAPIGATHQSSCCGNHLIALSDQPADQQSDTIQRYWDAGGNLTFDIGSFNYTAQTLISGVMDGWKNGEITLVDLGFEYGVDDPALLTSYEMNLFRFSAAKTLAEAQKLNQLFRSAPNFEIFYINAKNALDVFNKEWLATEYTTSVLTGESAATFTRLQNSLAAFPYWCYKTIGDNKVREAHRKLDGLILPANHPFWKKLFPPNGWLCRCYVVGRTANEAKGIDMTKMEAIAAEYFTSEDFRNSQKQGFAINRADTGEVFTSNQMYLKDLEGKAAAELNKLTYEIYNLKEFSEAKHVAVQNLPVGIDPAPDELIRDYHNRTLSIADTALKGSLNKYLIAVKKALVNPDEIWINGDGYNSFVSIKYYQDSTIVVISDIVDGKLYQVQKWLPVSTSQEMADYRKGLLIFNK